MSDQFKPVDWSYNTNVYEVNLRQYTSEGTFAAFEKELPRLKDMGIEVLWFMPVTPISTEKRLGALGSYYACSDYINTNPEFGSLSDFRHLVNAAHKLNMKVLIDWVANHTGWDHRWTKEHPEFYRRDQNGNFFDANGWADVIDLNYDNPLLRESMIEAMAFWVNTCDIDGFRCDMAMLVPLQFWVEARKRLDGIRKLFWLAECEEINYHEAFDATYSWRLLHKMEAFWRRETDINGVEEVLKYYETMFPPSALHLFFTTNHDENSHSGSEYERMGNAAKAFAVLCCTWKGIPLIYSGQELPNKKRLKFFEKDEIEWNGEYGLHYFYRTLLSLRKNSPALSAAEATEGRRVVTEADKFVFAFFRKAGNNEVLVVLNLSNENVPLLQLKDVELKGAFTNVFTGIETDFSNPVYLRMAPWDFQVYEKPSLKM